MKEGYIVCNMTSYGSGYEIFGVYESQEKAQQVFDKIIKKRYPGMTEDEIIEKETEDGDGHTIIHFIENTSGEW